ncbi:MAG: hypothetical protein F6K35_00785, partial [Okeania sp. SIO2H7]|nr:hypothetical protein [Okeania sp. SIO2H7]
MYCCVHLIFVERFYLAFPIRHSPKKFMPSTDDRTAAANNSPQENPDTVSSLKAGLNALKQNNYR